MEVQPPHSQNLNRELVELFLVLELVPSRQLLPFGDPSSRHGHDRDDLLRRHAMLLVKRFGFRDLLQRLGECSRCEECLRTISLNPLQTLDMINGPVTTTGLHFHADFLPQIAFDLPRLMVNRLPRFRELRIVEAFRPKYSSGLRDRLAQWLLEFGVMVALHVQSRFDRGSHPRNRRPRAIRAVRSGESTSPSSSDLADAHS